MNHLIYAYKVKSKKVKFAKIMDCKGLTLEAQRLQIEIDTIERNHKKDLTQ